MSCGGLGRWEGREVEWWLSGGHVVGVGWMDGEKERSGAERLESRIVNWQERGEPLASIP